jgi:tRNA-Thr(GGU) m(6)t(6)A37 methyltransferase TsaA
MKVAMQSIGTVTRGRKEKLDDYWGDSEATLELDAAQFSAAALQGLDSFSHLEIIFYFHQVATADILTGASHPRGNSAWPKCGIFAQRKKDRPNQIGVSVCELKKVDGLKIQVLGLDAIEGTPILDIKPVMTGFLPEKSKIREPAWAKELMCAYYRNENEREK